jgi:hypothetical protein
VVTHDGMHFHDEAVVLALRLEQVGHMLTASNGQLTVTNRTQLTAEDIAAIKQHRLMLLGIAGYTTTRVP